MNPVAEVLPDVYSVDEVARVAGVSRGHVTRIVKEGVVRAIDGRYLSAAQAVRAVRHLSGAAVQHHALFADTGGFDRRPALPIALSGTLHVLIALTVLLVTTMGFARPGAVTTPSRSEMRLVFLALPGPGGGGGGGGRKEPTPAPAAERKGVKTLRSPLPVRRPPPPRDPPPVVRASRATAPGGRTAATGDRSGGPGRRRHPRSRGRDHPAATAAGQPRNRERAAARARVRERASAKEKGLALEPDLAVGQAAARIEPEAASIRPRSCAR